MLIRFGNSHDVPAIHDLATAIWWPTYSSILSAEQIEFMLQQMYSHEALLQQLREGVIFIIAESQGNAVGFATYSQTDSRYKIQKLYIHPAMQGKGAGKQMLGFINSEALKQGIRFLELNVNRENPALAFYQKLGFRIREAVDIPYDRFILNDYIMEKEVTEPGF